MELRGYQQNAEAGVRESYRQENRAPLLVLPTGAGKTVVFSHIARNVSVKSKRVLILVHRMELLRQTAKALMKSGVAHGLISRKFTARYDLPVQVASVQTLARRLDKLARILSEIDLVIIDEAHHATSGQWRDILGYCTRARILGVTATPVRSDGQGLGKHAGGIFDDLIIGPQISELIAMGFLSSPIVYASRNIIDMAGVKVDSSGDYRSADLEKRVDKPKITGDAIAHYREHCDGMPAVVFCVSIKHAAHVAADFCAAGYRAVAVDGNMEDDARNRALMGLETGAVQVVCSCDLISEGTDIPAIAAAFLLRPTQSLGLFLQQVGRALRIYPGKTHAFIFDHVGNVYRHGMPDADREWSLDGEAAGGSGYSSGGSAAAPKLMSCASCNAVQPMASKCRHCGFLFVSEATDEAVPKVADGLLEKISGEEVAAVRAAELEKKRKESTEELNASTYEDLLRIEHDRKYKPGWAAYKWKARKKNAGTIKPDNLLIPD